MTTVVGRQAEAAAAAYLERQGCKILARNWRTRWCEIDVVAERGGVVYLCEVKYRRTVSHGGGLDYITARKFRQMMFAASLWTAQHDWEGGYEICAIEVSGADFRITAVVKDF